MSEVKANQSFEMDDRTLLEFTAKLEQARAWKATIRDLSEKIRVVEKEAQELIRERMPQLDGWDYSVFLDRGIITTTTRVDEIAATGIKNMKRRIEEAKARLFGMAKEAESDGEG